MASGGKIDLLAGRIPSFEEFFAPECFTESLDFSVFLDGISSIPLYERMGIKKELLSVDEFEKMDLEALDYQKKYKKRLKEKSEDNSKCTGCSIVKNDENGAEELTLRNETIQLEDLNKTLSEVNEDKGNAERFLKYLYNTNENNLLITTLQKNINFDVHPKSPKKSLLDNETNFSLKNMEDYLNDISNGRYDDFAFRHPSPLPSSSESDSDEEINSKAREFSLKFNISTNAYKYAFLKNIVDDSLKNRDYVLLEKDKSQVQPPKWISSDDDSETEEQRARQMELEVKRKKRKGTKNKNRSLPQSNQKSIGDSKLDNTSQPKPDNTIRSKQVNTNQLKQNDTSQFADTSSKNKDFVKKCNPALNKNPITQKIESGIPGSHCKQSKYAGPSNETVHGVNISPESKKNSATTDKGLQKNTKKNVKESRTSSETRVLETSSGSNIIMDKKIHNVKKNDSRGKLKENTKCNEIKNSERPEKQSMEMNQSTSSGKNCKSSPKLEGEINKIQSNFKGEHPEKEFPKELTSRDSSVLLEPTKTNNNQIKSESEGKNNISSSSSDEDWSKLAQRSLSAVDKILKHTSKK